MRVVMTLMTRKTTARSMVLRVVTGRGTVNGFTGVGRNSYRLRMNGKKFVRSVLMILVSVRGTLLLFVGMKFRNFTVRVTGAFRRIDGRVGRVLLMFRVSGRKKTNSWVPLKKVRNMNRLGSVLGFLLTKLLVPVVMTKWTLTNPFVLLKTVRVARSLVLPC